MSPEQARGKPRADVRAFGAVLFEMRGYNLSSKPEGLEPYKMKYLVEDVRQVAEKISGKDKKCVLVAHDWGANVACAFAMYHPEMPEKHKQVAQDIRRFIDDKNFPKDSVYRADVR